MRYTRLIFAALLVLAVAGVAQATTIADPKIIIGDPPINHGILLTPGHLNVLPPLVFNTDSRCTAGTNGGLPSMTCGIINDTNHPVAGLRFFFSTPQMLSLSTFTEGFGTWTPDCLSCTSATFTFSPALPDSEKIGALVTFVNFAAGLPIGVRAVPEPTTFTLLATGLGALLFRRRERKAIG